MSTPIQPVPPLVLASEFPSLADRPAGTYNAKAKAWADTSVDMAESLRDIAVNVHSNAVAADERAVTADERATDAENAKEAAETARDKAQEWAESDGEPEPGSRSAKGWAEASEGFKKSAEVAAAAAGSAAGLPSMVGQEGKALVVKSAPNPSDDPIVEWGDPVEIGDIRFSKEQPGPGFIRTGQRYLQSAYPDLFEKIGLLPSGPKTGPTSLAQTGIVPFSNIVTVGGHLVGLGSVSGITWWAFFDPASELWVRIMSVPATPLRSNLGYGNGVFLAGGSAPTAWSKSLDPMSENMVWSDVTGPGTNTALYSITYHEDEFFAFKSDGVFATANEGATWSTRTPLPDGSVLSSSISFKGMLVAGATNLYMSDDGAQTWNLVPTKGEIGIQKIFSFGDTLVVVYPRSVLFTQDLVNWDRVPITPNGSSAIGLHGAAVSLQSTPRSVVTDFVGGMSRAISASWPFNSAHLVPLEDGREALIVSQDSQENRVVNVKFTLYDYDTLTQFYVPSVATETSMVSWIKAENV